MSAWGNNNRMKGDQADLTSTFHTVVHHRDLLVVRLICQLPQIRGPRKIENDVAGYSLEWIQ